MKSIFLYHGEVIEAEFSAKNVHVTNSNIVPREDIPCMIKEIREHAKNIGYQYKRTNASWAREWMAHNYLYDSNIATDRTADVDLNEDESTLRRFGYFILSLLYR